MQSAENIVVLTPEGKASVGVLGLSGRIVLKWNVKIWIGLN
jgi:predicted fused transcriptional regulator/phosphomethylpyrimidine kinase